MRALKMSKEDRMACGSPDAVEHQLGWLLLVGAIGPCAAGVCNQAVERVPGWLCMAPPHATKAPVF